ncbi:MAG: urea ABC transporter ATP-binding subunit UrtE [Magnetococcales bacterium]|nr:urea ABC transporter ATP-binding subunit UrtE [Magnetococcales bacterium]
MLRVEGIDLFYGASQTLKRVNLSANIGRITCVLGRNGVGKTSLLRAVVGRHPIACGRIVWNGQEIGALPSHQRAARGIAFVPQGREIFPLLSVRENLHTGFATLEKSLHHVPDEIFDLFPVLAGMLHRRGGDLSGGQQQQLAIARALVTRPRLLVLDEPTEGIQPSIIKDIERVIRHLAGRGDMGILLVEQYFEFARDLADDFIVMDRGEVVMTGTRANMVEADVRRHLTV